MSIQTWLEEFMPIPAKITANESPKGLKGDLALLDHSIRKWEGLTEENLKRHGVEADLVGDLYVPSSDDRPPRMEVEIASDTCALCHRYMRRSEACEGCPLAYVRDDVPCCVPQLGERINPFRAWCDEKDPEPMIRWLRLARASVGTRLAKEKDDD